MTSELANGSPDAEVFLGFSDAFKARQQERRDKRNAFKHLLRDELKHGSNKEKLHAAIQAFNWSNPAAAIPRVGVLGLARLNFFGFATRLYPAFLTDEELKKGHFDIANAQKAKDSWDKVKKAWELMGGNPVGLEKRIKESHDRPVFHTKKAKAREEHEKNGIDGKRTYSYADLERDVIEKAAEVFGTSNAYDGGASVYISMGSSAFMGLMKKLVEGGAAKNPYADKNIDTTGMGDPNVTKEDQAVIDKMNEQAAKDKAAGLPLGDGDEKEDMVSKKTSTYVWIGVGVAVLVAGIIILKKVKK